MRPWKGSNAMRVSRINNSNIALCLVPYQTGGADTAMSAVHISAQLSSKELTPEGARVRV
jgi:hypothetical protein